MPAAAPLAADALARRVPEPSASESPTLRWPRWPSRSPAPSHRARATRERAPIPGARRGADGVWEFTRLPDKDERQMLYGQKWRVVESQKSRELFLGPDGEFGWDDFLDLINPLQHIPFVNMAYRAITGDRDLWRRAHGGRGLRTAGRRLDRGRPRLPRCDRRQHGDNAIAAVFGTGEYRRSGEEPMGDVSVNTASAQLADAAPIRRGSNK